MGIGGIIFCGIAIAFILFIIILFLKPKPKPLPSPPAVSPSVPFPSSTPMPKYFYYRVNTYDSFKCTLQGISHIANTVNIDQYIGQFFYNPILDRVEEILVSEFGDPAALTDYHSSGWRTCNDLISPHPSPTCNNSEFDVETIISKPKTNARKRVLTAKKKSKK